MVKTEKIQGFKTFLIVFASLKILEISKCVKDSSVTTPLDPKWATFLTFVKTPHLERNELTEAQSWHTKTIAAKTWSASM